MVSVKYIWKVNAAGYKITAHTENHDMDTNPYVFIFLKITEIVIRNFGKRRQNAQ